MCQQRINLKENREYFLKINELMIFDKNYLQRIYESELEFNMSREWGAKKLNWDILLVLRQTFRIKVKFKSKELSFCHKLKSSDPNIFAI